MRNFRELKVWEKAHLWVIGVYRVTRTFPAEERFCLVSQLRRSAGSVTANIAEGCGRESSPDFARFLSIAAGSASEAEYHLLLARDLGYLDEESHRELDGQINEVKRMLNSFIQALTAGESSR
jgi:four helix bundle protein